MLKSYLFVFAVFVGLAVNAQRMKESSRINPDQDFDFKVDTTELKFWTSNVSYYFNQGYAEAYMGVQLRNFVASFDENKDGRFSNLEFRRFQTGSRKLFSEATSFLAEKYDENKNRRLDKEEREVVRKEVNSFLGFSLAMRDAENKGGSAKEVLENKRALDDIYD